MSKRKQIVEVEPEGRIHKEAFATAPMTCPYCNGRGGFPIDTVDGPSIEECPDCKGTGEVIAVITIDWKPNKR